MKTCIKLRLRMNIIFNNKSLKDYLADTLIFYLWTLAPVNIMKP